MKKHKRTGHRIFRNVLKLQKYLVGLLLIIIFNFAALFSTGAKESGKISTTSNQINLVNAEKVKNEEVRNLVLTVDTDLTVPSNITAEEVEKMLEDYPNLKGLGTAFVKAEKEEGVNALYMLGLACLESSYGNSNFAVERNNLYGWCAYDSNPRKSKFF